MRRNDIVKSLLQVSWGDVEIKSAIGDGNCALHAILGATDEEYRNSTRQEKHNKADHLRTVLLNALPGYVDAFKFDSATDTELQDEIVGHRAWIGNAGIRFISYIMDINIIVIDVTNRRFTAELDYNPHNPMVFLAHDAVHYDYIDVDGSGTHNPGDAVVEIAADTLNLKGEW